MRRVGLPIGLILLALVSADLPAVAQQTPSQTTPDLVPVSIDVEPSDVQPGESAQIVAVVENRGGAAAEGFWVRLRVDNTIWNTRFVSALDAGERFTWRTPWVVDPEASALKLEVDTTDRVPEADEANNSLTAEIGFAADLVLDELTLKPRFPKPGDEVQVRVTVTNPSRRDITVAFAVEIQAERTTIATRFVQGLAAGASTAVTASWSAKVGPQLVRTIADSFDRVPESNADNNEAFLEIDVSTRDARGADLTVRDVRLDPETADPGDRVSLQATVTNAGTGPARSFEVGFWADGDAIDQTTVAGLSAGESTIVRFAWTVEAGQRRLRVLADAGHAVPEADESNNGRALTTEFGPELNACGQLVYLWLQADAADEFMAIVGAGPETVRNRIFPQIKRIMEIQYGGVNVRFVYDRPGRSHGTVAFRQDDESPILGRAPVGRRFSTGNVYMGSFVEFGLGSFAVSRIPILVGTVASHELGHMFGLRHPSPPTGGIMDASTQLSPVPGNDVPRFRPEARQQLQTLLPMACDG